ncbi:TPR-like protein [Stipitochalara longipes BDJ]|nr:TPR-like protein [Stipitochalara longipes BDJ]
MPLIYGEGRKKALFRLRKKTQKSQNAQSALSKDVRRVSLLAASENRSFNTFTSSFNDAPVDLLSIHFIDRERELGLVRNAYQVNEENTPTRCAIWGIPGVGKTQLALRYTKIFLEDIIASAVFWISCSNVEKLHQGFSKLLNLIDHPDQFAPEQSTRLIAARRWLEQSEVSGIFRWLLVLDNVDITALEFLRENLPRRGKQGQILITTRTEAVAHAVCKASGRLQLSFELEPPAMKDVIIYFLKSTGIIEDSMSSPDRRQLIDLIQCFGRLPFAVEHAASFMTQSSQNINSLTKFYRGDQKSHIFDWRNPFSTYEAKSISDLYSPPLHELRRSNPEALGLLNILVFWDPDGIEYETIKAGAPSIHSSFETTGESSKSEQNRPWEGFFGSSLAMVPRFRFAFSNKTQTTSTSNLKTEKIALPSSELESLIKLVSSDMQLPQALQDLQRLSFIKRRSAHKGGAYCMHDLTQTLVRVALESEGTYLQWFRCAVRIACEAFRQIENPALPEFWQQCEGLISHILSLKKYGELVDYKNPDLLAARTDIAAYWCNRGRYSEARETYQQILGIGSHALHSTGIDTTQWKFGLAEVNWHLGKHSESILLYEEVRQIRESQVGADHPDTLHVIEKMALVYRSQGRYTESRSMLKHVLESRKTTLGPDHLQTTQTMDELAMTLAHLHEYDEAENLFKQALALREAQLGTDHPDVLWTADNLATTYQEQGRHLEALELHEKVLKGRKVQLGEDHPQTLYTLANVATAYTSLGRFNEAEAMYKQAIVGNEQRLGHSHQQTLWDVEGLAGVCHQQARFEEATSLYNRALRGREDSLGSGHPSVMRIMHKLANLYRDQNDFIKSIELFERLLERRKTRLRSGHPEILQTYHDAAASYVRMGKYIEAEQCYRLELAGSIEEFGVLHPETKKREQYLVSFLREQEPQGKAAEGEAVANKETSPAQQNFYDTKE